MTYQVLARKWRPKKFQDVIGQEAITRSLQNAIKRGRLGHAYLFTGTRGIGKTSVARLFAQAIRCEALTPDGNPCGICQACQDMAVQNSMNVIEIDGASNNGVDEIRELINNVQYLPTNGKYKVYIIDEVHMLSKPAFNALLKTLEEPPAHVVFLLATTEANKLLGTVLSRCQRFDFLNASVESLMDHIKKISASEGIVFESEELIRDIAKLGNGSFRDTLSLLDQVLSYTSDNKVNADVLAQSLGIVRRHLIENITASILTNDHETALAGARQALNENIALKALVSALLDQLFTLVERLDDQDWLSTKPELENAVASVTTAELFWIYESLARDSAWIFDAIAPEQTFFVLIKKISLRRQLLGLELAPPAQVKKKLVEPIPTPKKEPVKQDLVGLLKYLEVHTPTLAANLEHAKLAPEDLATAELLEIVYPSESEVFFDVVSQDVGREKLSQQLNTYLGRKIQLKIELVAAKGDDVKTRAQERKEVDAKNDERRRSDILEDPMLKMAQDMFNTKIDKISLINKGD